MPELRQLKAAIDQRLYLDTSALVALVALAASKSRGRVGSTKDDDEQRGTALKEAIARANNATFLTSVLALQEIAAMTRNRSRNALAKKQGFSSWTDARAARSPHCEAIEKAAHTAQTEVLKSAIGETANLGIGVVHRLRAQQRPIEFFGQALVDSYIELAKAHSGLDSMDAMHLAAGKLLGATGYISFDKAWQTLPFEVWGA
ncbi:MAG: hypothetical protein U0174_14040 [Polyangiaceae bacterium]